MNFSKVSLNYSLNHFLNSDCYYYYYYMINHLYYIFIGNFITKNNSYTFNQGNNWKQNWNQQKVTLDFYFDFHKFRYNYYRSPIFNHWPSCRTPVNLMSTINLLLRYYKLSNMLLFCFLFSGNSELSENSEHYSHFFVVWKVWMMF